MATTTYGTTYATSADLVSAWPTDSLSVANSVDAAGYYIGRGLNPQTASYVGIITDAGKTVTMTVATANTFTIPTNASVAYPIGTRINILNLGAGACTVTPTATVTVNGTVSPLATNESAAIVKTATNIWSYLAASAPGLSLVTPTSVAGTGVTLSGGAVSFSGSTSVSVNGCFTSTYENYRVVWTAKVAAAAQNLLMRLRAAGTDNTSAIYNYGSFYYQSDGVVNASNNTATSWQFNALTSTQIVGGALDVIGPQLAAVTLANGVASGEDAAGRGRIWTFGGNHATATAFDGFTILVGGSSITGSLRVYGYRNS